MRFYENDRCTVRTTLGEMRMDFSNINDEQRSEIENTEGPLLIIAGPGTGKTFTLVKRIAYLVIDKNVKPSEIMGGTFTDKAARDSELQ